MTTFPSDPSRPFGRRLSGLLLAVLLVGCAGTPAATTLPATPTAAATATTAQPTVAPTPAPTTAAARATATAPAAPTAAPSPAPTVTTAPAATVAPSGAATAPQPATRPEFSASGAFVHVEALAVAVGIRAAGTEGEAKGAAYIDDYLAKLGYRVSRQPFPITSFRDEGVTLTVPGADLALQPVTMRFSAGGQVTAPLAPAGLGTPDDLARAGVQGKIALVERGGLTFQEKATNAKAAGAAALVVYNNADGALTGSLTAPVELPVAGLTRAEGQRLRQQVEQRGPVEAALQVKARTERTPSQNVIAVRPDLPANLPIIVVGGHLDSVPAGPGANDNASGTAVVLEMARVLAGERRAEIRFVAFGAEEIGLLGSKYYVDQLPAEERRRMVAMINLDMLAVGEELAIGGSDDLATRAIAIAQGLGEKRVTRLGGGDRFGGSDHANFIAAGIPALFLNRPNDPRYHTAEDQATYVEPEALRVAGEVSLRIIEQVLSR